jgi:transcriptional regulator with XRE-family HTH domain
VDRPFDPVTVGERLRAARRRRRLTQGQAAGAVGLTRNTYLQMEKGRRELRPSEAVTLAAYFGVEVGEIVGDGAARLRRSDPLGMVAELLDRVRRYREGELSEGQLVRFLGLDRVTARGVVTAVEAMATVIDSLLPDGAPPP